ncbi:MAG TPA: M48 family metallopeptidase [Terriglobales bacterium]
MERRTFPARILALTLSLLIALPVSLLAQAEPQLPDPGSVGGVTKEQQEQVGLQAMAEVYKQMPVLPDSSPETQYIQQLGKKLAAVIPPENSWPFQFHVIQQKEINAFALPGGPMFVNIGTITAADNEAELAGVMAHEMAHVYMQHSVKQASKTSMTQGLLGVLGSVLGNGTVGSLAKLGIGIGAGALTLKYSRGDEAQADAVGAIIMYRAGYDPKALPAFFQKLEQEAGGGGGGPQFLSDHPNPGNRVAAVSKEIQNWPPRNFQTNSQAFASAKQHAAGVKAYSAQEIAAGAKQGTWAAQNQKNGSIPANLPPPPSDQGAGPGGGTADLSNVSLKQVKPSGRFKQLQQGPVSMSYPDNWQVSSDQNSGITIAPAAGASQGGVAYGVVINMGQDQNASSIDQVTQNLVQGLTQSNPGLRASGNPKSITVNGVQGRAVDLIGNSPVQQNGQPVPERDRLVVLPRSDGTFVYMVFVAPQRDFNSLSSTYDKMLKSVRLS